MSRYPSVGNVARLTCVFVLEDTITRADPTTVTVSIKPPGQNPTTTTPIRDDIGEYHYDLTLNAPGDWYYRFTGTGTVIAQTPDGRIVVPPSF